MIKKLHIVLFLLPLYTFGQTFYKTYGGYGNDYGSNVLLTKDSCFAVIGATESFGNGSTDYYLLKLDTGGNILWSKTFGGENVDWGMDLVQTSDSGYLLGGYSNSLQFDYDFFVIKTDKNGNSIWTKRYGGLDWDFCNNIAKTPDSNYILCGETYSYGNGISDAYVVKINDTGDTLWTKTFGSNGKDSFNDVFISAGGNYLFAGQTQSPNGDWDAWLVKTDTAGNLLWQYTSGDTLEDYGRVVSQYNDTLYYFSSDREDFYTKHDIAMELIDTNGIPYNLVLYGDSLEDTGRFLNHYHNSYFFQIGGALDRGLYGNGDYDIFLAEWHPILNYTPYSPYINNLTRGTYTTDIAMGADTTYDKGFVLAGYTKGTINGLSSIVVIKGDSTYTAGVSEVFTEIIDPLSEIEMEKETILSVFPNPASDFLLLKTNLSLSKSYYEIVTLDGKIVDFGFCEGKIPLNKLAKGNYFLTLPELQHKAIPFSKL